MLGPAPLSTREVADVICDGWATAVAAVEHAELGAGSHHWIARDTRGSRWFVTLDDDAKRVLPAYGVADALERTGFGGVRPPLRAADGSVGVEIDGVGAITIWPWLDGHLGGDEADLQLLREALGELHTIRGIEPPSLAYVEHWDIRNRVDLERMLDELDDPWLEGPHAEHVRGLLRPNRDQVLAQLNLYDEMVGATPHPSTFVLTHGQPHAHNVIYQPGRAVLIDWESVRWAPAERDLWFLPPPARSRGAEPRNEALVETYRLRWALDEIAGYSHFLRTAAASTAWHDFARDHLTGCFHPHRSS
jgi:spectinomycin phosphotransferase